MFLVTTLVFSGMFDTAWTCPTFTGTHGLQLLGVTWWMFEPGCWQRDQAKSARYSVCFFPLPDCNNLQVIFYGWMRDRSVKIIDITYFRINWEIMDPLISSFLPFFFNFLLTFSVLKNPKEQSLIVEIWYQVSLLVANLAKDGSEPGEYRSWGEFLGIQTSRVGWKGWCGLRRVAVCFFLLRNLPSFEYFPPFFFGKTFFFQFQHWRMTLRQV